MVTHAEVSNLVVQKPHRYEPLDLDTYYQKFTMTMNSLVIICLATTPFRIPSLSKMPLFVIILFSCSLTLTYSESVCTLPNTGSVLFRNIDVDRKYCWSREELALLYSRRVMMDLIPRQIPHNIPLILEYLHICLNTLREVATSDKTYDFMVAALADTFGGYLQTYGLPLLHEAYYEGYVSYDNAAEFHRLQDNFKSILMTNGEGWTKPMEVRKHINRILPLKMPSTVSSKPCALLLTDATTTQKSAVDELSACENQTSPLIPLPIIDDGKNPNSIAVPFKNHALFNLKSRNSYDVLIKYYIEASRCIFKTQQTGLEQSEFDHVFVNWLKSKIIPHLRDDSWFVGFSNVLRIEETIQQREGMISAGSTKQKEEESLFSELESETQVTTTTYIMIFVILLASLLFICFLYWAFIKNCIMCCGNVDVESDSQEDSSDRTSLLSASEGSSIGRGKRRPCKHGKNQIDSSNSTSARSATEGSKLTMTCGLGKGFCRSRNRN